MTTSSFRAISNLYGKLTYQWQQWCKEVTYKYTQIQTRHRVSTSMYSLTFCIRFLLPECHQWKAHIPDCRSNVENGPRRRPVAGGPAAPACRMRADPAQPTVRTMSSYHGMDASLELGFALFCHSNATRAPIANPPNSAQLEGSLYHAPKLHPGPCSSVGVWPRTDTHTQTRVTTIHFASSTTHTKCNKYRIYTHTSNLYLTFNNQLHQEITPWSFFLSRLLIKIAQCFHFTRTLCKVTFSWE